MFVVDSLLGNFDRHNGNWGFLFNKKEQTIKIAPVYDCGSCLFSQASDELMEYFLSTPEEMNKRTYEFPNSALKLNDKKINPYEYINSLKNNGLNLALLRIVPKINIEEISKIVDDCLYISDVRKTFYKTIINKRYEEILLAPYNKLVANLNETKNKENEENQENSDEEEDEL